MFESIVAVYTKCMDLKYYGWMSAAFETADGGAKLDFAGKNGFVIFSETPINTASS